MNNKNSVRRKAAFLCLAAAISGCETSDPATSGDLTIMAQWSADSLVSATEKPSARGRIVAPTGMTRRQRRLGSKPTYRIVDGVPMVHFDGIDDYLTAGAATDWRFLKDGSDWTVFVVFRSVAGEAGGKHVLLDSDGEDSGFAISYDDRPDAQRSEAVRLAVADASGALSWT